MLFHEVKTDDYAQNKNDHILNGKDKEHQDNEDKLDQNWAYKHSQKLYWSDLVASVDLDEMELSICPRSA